MSDAVASPCTNVCRMNPHSGLCDGCLRRLDEIAAWPQMSDGERRGVWEAIARRRTALELHQQPQPSEGSP